MMREWKAHYKDEFHDEDIIIVNEEADKCDNLTFTIDGITFRGSDISRFKLMDPAQEEQARSRFRLIKWGGTLSMGNLTVPFVNALQ